MFLHKDIRCHPLHSLFSPGNQVNSTVAIIIFPALSDNRGPTLIIDHHASSYPGSYFLSLSFPFLFFIPHRIIILPFPAVIIGTRILPTIAYYIALSRHTGNFVRPYVRTTAIALFFQSRDSPADSRAEDTRLHPPFGGGYIDI